MVNVVPNDHFSFEMTNSSVLNEEMGTISS